MHAKSFLTIITTVAVFGTSVIAAPIADTVELAEREFFDESLDLVEREYLDSAIDLEARSVFGIEDLEARDFDDLAEFEAREFEELDARQDSTSTTPPTPVSPTGSLASAPNSPLSPTSPMSPGLGSSRLSKKQRRRLQRRLRSLRRSGPPSDKKELAAYNKRVNKLRKELGLKTNQKGSRRARAARRKARRAAAAAAGQTPTPSAPTTSSPSAAGTQTLQPRSFFTNIGDFFKRKPKAPLTEKQKARLSKMGDACKATKDKKKRNRCNDYVRRFGKHLEEGNGFVKRIRETSGVPDV